MIAGGRGGVAMRIRGDGRGRLAARGRGAARARVARSAGLALIVGIATSWWGQAGGVEPGTAAPAGESPAWQRVDRYEPPDFARFFPDKPAGVQPLEAAFAYRWRDRSAGEVMRLVREGLRGVRPVGSQVEILKSVGMDYVWRSARQDPAVIEILYHALDPKGPLASAQNPAAYYGLMRVQPQAPAILHALVDWCMAGEADWENAGFAGRANRAELLAFLQPYRDSADPATRERAAVVEKFLVEAPDREEARLAWTTKLVRARSAGRLPEVKKALRSGTARERQAALDEVTLGRLALLADDDLIAALAVCAEDQDPSTRRDVTRALGQIRVAPDAPWADAWVDLMLRLLRDESPWVRAGAVHFGLIPPPEVRTEEVVRGLIEQVLVVYRGGPAAAENRQRQLADEATRGLQRHADLVIPVLDEILRGGDQVQAAAVRSAYRALAGRMPPGDVATSPDDRRGYVAAFRALHDELKAKYPMFALKGIDWDAVGRELLPRVEAAATEAEFGRLVEELVARLEDSHAGVLPGSAMPPPAGLPEWGVGVACLIDDRDRPVVYDVAPGSPAARQGVRPGMTVAAVDGAPAAAALERWMGRQRRFVGYSSDRYLRYDAARQFLNRAKRGEKVALTLEDVEGSTRTVELAAGLRGRYVRRLPVARPGVDDGGADFQAVVVGDGVGYLIVRRIRAGLEAGIDRSLAQLKGCDRLILDVRGNSGGGFDAATAFRNFDPAAPADPERIRFAGPIALLVDERCISAGEGWASWFVAHKRARLFGSTTAGASSRKETYELSNGLYKVTFSVKAYAGFLDRPIERTGLVPNVEVRCTARDLAAGRDTVAEAAVAWLKEARAE